MDVVGRSGCGGGFDCFLQNCVHTWCHGVGWVYLSFTVWALALAWLLSVPFLSVYCCLGPAPTDYRFLDVVYGLIHRHVCWVTIHRNESDVCRDL